MVLHFGVALVALADTVFDDAVANLVAVGHLDDVIAERARQAPGRGIFEVPDVMFDVELALVVAMRPALEPTIQSGLQEIARRQRADLEGSPRPIAETGF